MAFKSKKKFEYKPRDPDETKARATAGGNREGFLVEGVKTFGPKSGDHTVRVLPPTWDGAKHYGMDVWAHYNVGPDGGSYLCLQKMRKEACPLCDERQRAIKDQDEDLEAALKPRQRVACWVIDRDNERDGPLLWMMPWTLDREFAQQSIDKKTGEVCSVDDPENGYDVSFRREGDGPTTKYVGVQLERKPSPLSDDEETSEEWLAFVNENPVPDQLVYQDESYLQEIVGDGLTAPKNARDKAKGKDDDKRGSRTSRKDAKDDDERPARARKSNGKDEEEEDEDDDKGSKRTSKAKAKDEIDVDELDWEGVHKMDEDELTALAEQEGIDIEDADDEAQAADMICKALKIKEPEKKARPALGSKLRDLRSRNSK